MAKAITPSEMVTIENRTGHPMTGYPDGSYGIRFNETLYNYIVSDMQDNGYQLRGVWDHGDYSEAIFEPVE